jgi:hypothetical protein
MSNPSMPRATKDSRQNSSMYGSSALMFGTPGWMSQSIAPSMVMVFSVSANLRARHHPFNPARRSARCQSVATASSASLAFFCPVSTDEMPLRSANSIVGQIGSRGSSVAVFMASASTGAQP